MRARLSQGGLRASDRVEKDGDDGCRRPNRADVQTHICLDHHCLAKIMFDVLDDLNRRPFSHHERLARNAT